MKKVELLTRKFYLLHGLAPSTERVSQLFHLRMSDFSPVSGYPKAGSDIENWLPCLHDFTTSPVG